MVRELSNNNDYNLLFVKKSYLDFFKFMYKDLKNILFYIVDDKNGIDQFINQNNDKKYTYNFSGLYGNDWPGKEYHFDETFYRQVNINYEKRWTSFKLNRDENIEMNYFNKFNIKENSYNFYHEDIDRNYKIKDDYKTNIIITTNMIKTNNIFDYCYLIENATEVHCIDSCFRCLVEHLNIKGKLFFHQYSKGTDGWNVPYSKKTWKVIR